VNDVAATPVEATQAPEQVPAGPTPDEAAILAENAQAQDVLAQRNQMDRFANAFRFRNMGDQPYDPAAATAEEQRQRAALATMMLNRQKALQEKRQSAIENQYKQDVLSETQRSNIAQAADARQKFEAAQAQQGIENKLNERKQTALEEQNAIENKLRQKQINLGYAQINATKANKTMTPEGAEQFRTALLQNVQDPNVRASIQSMTPFGLEAVAQNMATGFFKTGQKASLGANEYKLDDGSVITLEKGSSTRKQTATGKLNQMKIPETYAAINNLQQVQSQNPWAMKQALTLGDAGNIFSKGKAAWDQYVMQKQLHPDVAKAAQAIAVLDEFYARPISGANINAKEWVTFKNELGTGKVSNPKLLEQGIGMLTDATDRKVSTTLIGAGSDVAPALADELSYGGVLPDYYKQWAIDYNRAGKPVSSPRNAGKAQPPAPTYQLKLNGVATPVPKDLYEKYKNDPNYKL
jgi:hypothetical protein